jgi:glycosyltransferase involved in cell wall biosynthesis
LGFAGSEKVQVVRNGVDTEFFSPSSTPTDQRDLLFVGNMGYPPNVNAVTTLVSEILPLVRGERPQTDLLIAGARPTKAVQQLGGVGIEVSGWLDDIRSAYERGRIMVVPLVIGAGLQNKILEAMSMGVPCVTTELVNRAIGAVPDEEILIATSAQEFAQQTLRLLESPELYSRISAGGLKLVQSRYSWQAVGETLIAAFAHRG